MLRFSEKTSLLKRKTRKGSLRYALLMICIAGSAACRQDMQDQPKMKPFRGTTFFRDGLSGRPPVEGTVPRGFLRADTEFFTGKKSKTAAQGSPSPQPVANAAAGANPFADDVEVFPLPVTEDVLKRGRERYEIFCVVCHGLTGNGDGMVVRRGFRRAASFHDDRLRQAPVGHFFDAITNGWGAMPSYAPQIPVQDRWAIVGYIRALQLSQKNSQQAAASASPSPTPTTAGGHGP
jgi:mono/diheme cytochrome c family protein